MCVHTTESNSPFKLSQASCDMTQWGSSSRFFFFMEEWLCRWVDLVINLNVEEDIKQLKPLSSALSLKRQEERLQVASLCRCSMGYEVSVLQTCSAVPFSIHTTHHCTIVKMAKVTNTTFFCEADFTIKPVACCLTTASNVPSTQWTYCFNLLLLMLLC